jgi:uncharacterized Fe-S center protein
MLYKRIDDIPVNLSGRVAIKLHMGEAGNKTHVSPSDARVLVDKVKENGGEAFLVDTTTLYPKRRYTVEGYQEVAKENGFGGFNVIIAKDDVFEEINGIKLSKEILDADSLLVLSHGKGHGLTGFGGAVKNIGMGCVVKDGKRKIHSPTFPKYDESNCTLCGSCTSSCFANLIKIENGKLEIDIDKCSGCGACANICKTGAMWIPNNATEQTFDMLALAAKGFLSRFKGNVQYINVLKNITRFCDCSSDPGPVVCRDIGYLTGDNPLKLDSESMEMIKKKNPNALDFDTWELFEKIAKKHF